MTRVYGFIAVLALGVAASTGVLLRFGLYLGMPHWAQNYVAVRHAHSHLMYFGWVTLGLMALIWRFLPELTGRPLPTGVAWQMSASAGLALISFPAFWINGYGLTQIGTLALPLGAMAAGLNGLVWFVFIGLYVGATWQLSVRPLAVQLWDWALVLMVAASLGAMGVAGVAAMDLPNAFIQQFFLHLFLDLFAVGWFNLAILGVLWAWVARYTAEPTWLPSGSLAILAAPTFILGMSPALVTNFMFWVAVLANLGMAILLVWHLCALWQRRIALPPLVWFALAALAVYMAGALILVWPGVWRWSGNTELRIFFLHNFLLGWISSVLLGVLLAEWGSVRAKWTQIMSALWMGGTATLILALLGLGFTQFLPLPVVDWFRIAAWSSLLPASVAVWAITQLAPSGRQTTTIWVGPMMPDGRPHDPSAVG